MKKVLTQNECSLLQQYYDGDQLDAPAVAQVELLLNTSPTARVFMGALEELTVATRAAEEAMWEQAEPPTALSVVEAAMSASTFAEASLEELAPMLERFFDGEVMGEEMATVQALINERDDVADYLAGLDGLRTSVLAGHEQIVEGVSFDGFWDAIDAQLPEAAPATPLGSFEPEEHRVLLYRYHDAEVDAAERARVDAWLAEGEPTVVATLAALSELRLATVTALETAESRVDFGQMWHGIEDALDDQIESQGENVVSFARQKRDRTTTLGDGRSIAMFAIAAMLFVAFGAGIFKDQLFGPSERIVVEKTVVIVDSVEYQPGSSVMVNTVRPVSSVSVDGETVEEEPTVIWLLDSSADEGSADDANAEPADETTTEETSDQPI